MTCDILWKDIHFAHLHHDPMKELHMGSAGHKVFRDAENINRKAKMKAHLFTFIQDENKNLTRGKDYQPTLTALVKSRINLIAAIVEQSILPVTFNNWDMEAESIMENNLA
jgi:hypothetical protein